MSDTELRGIGKSMIEEGQSKKPNRLRGYLRRKIEEQNREHQRRKEVERERKAVYEKTYNEQRVTMAKRYARQEAIERARSEAKDRMKRNIRGGGTMETLGRIGEGAQAFGAGLSAGMDTAMFGRPPSQPRRLPSKRKTGPKKQRKRKQQRPRRPDPFGFLY